MFDTLSIRLKIVLLSGLCLLGVIALIVGINLYQTNQNDQLVSDSSSRMLTDSVQQPVAGQGGGTSGAVTENIR